MGGQGVCLFLLLALWPLLALGDDHGSGIDPTPVWETGFTTLVQDYDSDGDGEMSIYEFRLCLVSLGVSGFDIRDLFYRGDANFDGRLSVAEGLVLIQTNTDLGDCIIKDLEAIPYGHQVPRFGIPPAEIQTAGAKIVYFLQTDGTLQTLERTPCKATFCISPPRRRELARCAREKWHAELLCS